MTIRTVLIPLDGSELSRQIVRVVRTFISPDGVQLVLFRVAYPPAVSPDGIPGESIAGPMPVGGAFESYSRAVDAGFDAARRQLSDAAAMVEAELADEVARLRQSGYSVRAEVQFGDAATRIIEYVNANDVDLVAMATHGRSGLGRLVLGSVAERVVRGVSAPVLLMRSSPAETDQAKAMVLSSVPGDTGPLRMAVATDCSPLSQRAVTRASHLAQLMHADFQLLVVAGEQDSSEQCQRKMEEAVLQVSELEPRPETIPLVGYADEVLLQRLATDPVDILCFGAFQDQGAGFTAAIGPTAQRLVQHAPTSVLVFKSHRSRIRRILACLAVEDSEIVDVAAHLAKAAGAELTLLHVIPQSAAPYLSPAESSDKPSSSDRDAILAEPPEAGLLSTVQVLSQGTRLSSLLSSWIARLEEHGFGREAMLLEQGSAPEAILRTAQEGSYDLIIVGSHSGPGHFLSSAANAVVRFAEQSVLLLRPGLVERGP